MPISLTVVRSVCPFKKKKKKKKMIFMKCTSKKSNGGAVSFNFLTSVHERRSIKIDITSKLYIRAG